jgi:DNA phosphorothioation-dependent restriction protein DptG
LKPSQHLRWLSWQAIIKLNKTSTSPILERFSTVIESTSWARKHRYWSECSTLESVSKILSVSKLCSKQS